MKSGIGGGAGIYARQWCKPLVENKDVVEEARLVDKPRYRALMRIVGNAGDAAGAIAGTRGLRPRRMRLTV